MDLQIHEMLNLPQSPIQTSSSHGKGNESWQLLLISKDNSDFEAILLCLQVFLVILVP